MSKNTIIGIDLAKTVFQIATMSDNKITMNKRVNRKELRLFMVNHPAATVVMEACYSSHYWAREFERMGHSVLLVPAQHVKPFVRGNKTDAKRRRRHYRSLTTSRLNLRTDENNAPARHPVLAPYSRSLSPKSHRSEQSNARFTHRLRHRHGQG